MNEECKLLHKIENLLTLRGVVAVCHAGSDWQRQFIERLANGRRVLDFADPVLRERALLAPDEVVGNSADNIVIYNLQNLPEALGALLRGDGGSCLIITCQWCDLPEDICRVRLPLNGSDASGFTMDDKWLGNIPKAENTAFDIYDSILAGSLCSRSVLGGYVKNFLQYDVKELTAVSDGMKFYKFMCFVAASTGNVVNYAALGKSADISSPTAKQWLRYLEGAGIIALLPPLENAGGKRLAKAPKVYFRDTGLACYLLRIVSREDLLNSPVVNALFETWVVMRLREGYLAAGEIPQLSYYRDSNAKEIGLLVRSGNVLHPLEIKREPVNMRRVEKKFTVFADLLAGSDSGVGVGGVIGLYKTPERTDGGLWLLPVWTL